MQTLDLSFAVVGKDIPLDHGYLLYSALSHILPGLHRDRDAAVHPIRGDATGDGTLRIAGRSRLCIRTGAERIADILALSGKTLFLGRHPLRIGVPQVLSLTPATNVAARMVTIRGFIEPADFLAAARRQLDALGISPGAVPEIPTSGDGQAKPGQPIRRILRIKDKTIVGFALHVSGLTAEESLTLQEKGLGGRRHMGCGVFVPIPDREGRKCSRDC